MRNPLLKDTFREIRKTKGRFFSIFAIVAIGVAFFAGILASAPTMRYNADQYFDEYNLMDYRVLSNFGLTEDDIDELKKIEGIEAVMPAYSADVLVSVGSSESVVRVHSLDLNHMDSTDPLYINQLKLVEGRFPTSENEVVIEKGKMVENSLEIGDEMVLRSGTDEEINDIFKSTKYTVVGKVETPYYLSYQKGTSSIGGGTVNLFAYIPVQNFDMEVYTEAFLTVSDVKKLNSYEKVYFDEIKPITSNIETLGIERSEIRRDDILSEAQEKYDEGQEEYEDGLNTFNEEIAKAEKEIEEGKYEILKGEMTLQNNKDITQLKLDQGQADIDSGKEQLKTLTDQYNQAEKVYQENNADAIAQRNEANTNLQAALVTQTERQNALDEVNSRLNPLRAQQTERNNKQSELTELNTELTALQGELADLNTELAGETDPDKQAEIQDQITSKEAEIASKQADISAKQAEIDSYDPTLDTQITLIQAEQTTAQTNLATATLEVTRYQATVTTIDQGLLSARTILDALKTQIETSEKQIEDGEIKLAEGTAEAQNEFAKAEKELEQAKKDLEDGQKELEEKRSEGQEELEDAREELVKAANEISEIQEAQWYVLDRESHYGYVDYRGATERMDAIATVFPVFFILVAALVCLTTMTRMVDEQRTQIGTMKALGYSVPQIAFKYVFYAFFASLSGSVVGLAIGIFTFPAIIYTAWNMMYILPTIRFMIPWSLMVLSSASSILVTTLAAFAACYKELIETPSLLMRPKAPKTGKKILLERIPVLWKNFSFTSKVTARNIFRYKKRFFMTVVGISGCTALLIAGFGIKDSISTIVDQQFGVLFKYDAVASLKADVSETRKAEIIEELKSHQEIDDVMDVYDSNAVVTKSNETKEVSLIVVKDTEQFKDYVDFHERVSQKEVSLSSSGVIISEHMANQMKISVGDEIQLENKDGIQKSVKVEGIIENYVGHYVYMTSATYKNTFDLRPVTNSLFIKVNEAYHHDDSEPAKVISSVDEVDTLAFYTSLRDNFRNMIKSLDFIVVVLIISAGALAFVVLYNLTNVNISERLREIATLKVLGFHDKEVNAYVYKENIILTLIGALVGIGVGKALHLVIMVVVELDNIMFGRTIQPMSLVISVVITIFFAVFVNQVMKKKLKRIPMVESLKSVE